jgi:hypothetical protein
MKLTTTLLAGALALSATAQHFEIEGDIQTIYSNYKGYTLPMATMDNQFIIHGADNMEITDIQTGKIIYEWDPQGGYGTSYVSADGKWIANRSQNYKDPELGYVDAYSVLNTATKKEYLTVVPDELWSTTGFANNMEQVAIQTHNFEDNKTRLVTFDFVNDKILKTLYTSEKSSTVILAIAYSLDDKYVYATIATNSSTSTFYVFDAESGDQVDKTSLIHQADRIFVTPERIIVSGAHGMKATDHTTLISPKDYNITKEWKNVRVSNVDPSDTYSIIYDYEDNILESFDLSSGEKHQIIHAKDMKLYPISCAFTADGNYFAIARSNGFEYYKTREPGEYEALYVFNNNLIENPTFTTVATSTENTPPPVAEEETENNDWYAFSSATPAFEVNLPTEAKGKSEKNNSGGNTFSVTSASKTEACIISASEIASVKEKKYKLLAEKLAEDFISKKSPTNIKKGTYSFKGQEGVEYTFLIGKFEYMYRVFCIDGYAYQLIYLAPQLDSANYNKFFESFVLK